MHMRKSRGRTPLVFLSVVVLLGAPGGVLSAFTQQRRRSQPRRRP